MAEGALLNLSKSQLRQLLHHAIQPQTLYLLKMHLTVQTILHQKHQLKVGASSKHEAVTLIILFSQVYQSVR